MGSDANKDGKVTKDELLERMQRIFEQGDLDKDGAINREEAEKFGRARGGRDGRGDRARGDRPVGEERPQRAQ